MIRLRSRSSRSFSDHGSSSIFLSLERKVRLLDFASFQVCVCLWLSSQGFAHIRSLGRCHQRGRRKSGGACFVATVRKDPEIKVAVQLRHCQTPIQRKAVDELRGFMLRHAIPSGLIVCNGRFQDSAVLAAESYRGRPIELVSLRDLAKSMVSHGLGVIDQHGWQEADSQFFKALEHLRPAVCPACAKPCRKASACAIRTYSEIAEVQIPSPNPPFRWLWYVIVALLLLAFFSTLWLARESL